MNLNSQKTRWTGGFKPLTTNTVLDSWGRSNLNKILVSFLYWCTILPTKHTIKMTIDNSVTFPTAHIEQLKNIWLYGHFHCTFLTNSLYILKANETTFIDKKNCCAFLSNASVINMFDKLDWIWLDNIKRILLHEKLKPTKFNRNAFSFFIYDAKSSTKNRI